MIDRYSSGPFCRIEITHNIRDGVRVWAIRNPKYRVDTSGVMLNTITCQESFENGGGRLSPFVPTSYLKD